MSDNTAAAVKALKPFKGVKPKVKGNPLIKKPTAAHVNALHAITLSSPNTLEPTRLSAILNV